MSTNRFGIFQEPDQTAASSSSSVARQDDVNAFISGQDIIRVAMTNGPNYGDQANTVNVMNRCRQMGFKGVFEVIYSSETANRIATLFGLAGFPSSVYEDKSSNIIFIDLNAQEERVRLQSLPMVDLGFSVGGNGIICSCHNAFTRTFLQFSSFLDPSSEYHNTRFRVYGANTDTEQKGTGAKYLIFPRPDVHDVKNYLEKTSQGRSLLLERIALRVFIEGMINGNFNVLPIYGRTLRFGGEEKYDNSHSPSNMLQTIAGARYAQLNGSADLGKPLIIAMFDNYHPYAEQLMKLIHSDNWGAFEKPGVEIIRNAIQQTRLAGAISIANATSADAVEKMKSLKPGEILILSLGPLPKLVFDGLFCMQKENIWPPIAEGAGTLALLTLTGKPYFECGDRGTRYWNDSYYTNWTMGYDSISDPELKAKMQHFYDIHNGYGGTQYIPSPDQTTNGTYNYLLPWSNNIYQELGEFIIAAADPSSSFSRYFQFLNKSTEVPENDRIYYAFREMIPLLVAMKKNSAESTPNNTTQTP